MVLEYEFSQALPKFLKGLTKLSLDYKITIHGYYDDMNLGEGD